MLSRFQRNQFFKLPFVQTRFFNLQPPPKLVLPSLLFSSNRNPVVNFLEAIYHSYLAAEVQKESNTIEVLVEGKERLIKKPNGSFCKYDASHLLAESFKYRYQRIVLKESCSISNGSKLGMFTAEEFSKFTWVLRCNMNLIACENVNTGDSRPIAKEEQRRTLAATVFLLKNYSEEDISQICKEYNRRISRLNYNQPIHPSNVLNLNSIHNYVQYGLIPILCLSYIELNRFLNAPDNIDNELLNEACEDFYVFYRHNISYLTVQPLNLEKIFAHITSEIKKYDPGLIPKFAITEDDFDNFVRDILQRRPQRSLEI